MRRSAWVLMLAVALLAGCSSAAAPTPLIVYVTPEPTVTASPPATPTAEPTEEPTAEPTEEPTEEPTAEPVDACSDSTDGVEGAMQNLTTLLMNEAVDAKYKGFSAAKAAAKKPSYKTFFRNAEDYETEPVYFKGEVIQVLYEQPWGGYDCQDVSPLLDGDSTVLRVDVTYEGYGFYTDTVYVVYLGTKRIIEDDIVDFVGVGTGLETYESTMGGSVTIPSVLVGKYLFVR